MKQKIIDAKYEALERVQDKVSGKILNAIIENAQECEEFSKFSIEKQKFMFYSCILSLLGEKIKEDGELTEYALDVFSFCLIMADSYLEVQNK